MLVLFRTCEEDAFVLAFFVMGHRHVPDTDDGSKHGPISIRLEVNERKWIHDYLIASYLEYLVRNLHSKAA